MFKQFNNLPDVQAQAIAWKFLLAARDWQVQPRSEMCCLSYNESSQQVIHVDNTQARICLWLDETGAWCYADHLPTTWQSMFDLYLPVLGPHRLHDKGSRVIAHLGQSIDACIATLSGDSFYVTGEENRKHLHCLRALSDAVIVGAGTVVADDPQLTTRAVPGHNPVRIVIDPLARLSENLGLCTDGQARTILLHQSTAELAGKHMAFGPMIFNSTEKPCHQVERWILPGNDMHMSYRAIVEYLCSRGLRKLFVEGGGVTVSRFLKEKTLHRLHVAVAPLLVGQGTQALQLDASTAMSDALRPPCAIYRMGDDIMWDLSFEHDTEEVKSSENQSARSSQSTLSHRAIDRIA